MRSKTTLVSVACMALTFAFAQGCLQRELGSANPCLVSGVSDAVPINSVDKVDLLFMIDNSSSMEDKQKNLRQHVPQLVQALVKGRRSETDPHPFPPVKDLHIAVVSSDLGLVGVPDVPADWHCSTFGDDGAFLHTPHPSAESMNCDASYPTYLSYIDGAPNGVSPMKLAQDFGCIANVGAKGCGFEQQLESTLKALWPAHYVDPSGQVTAAHTPVFLTDTVDPTEALGHGDGLNAGFLRDETTGPSLLVIIALSDEEDGSTPEPSLYTQYSTQAEAPAWLEPSTLDNMNLRPLIGRNREHLYPVSRYVNAFKALRPNSPQLVVYAAITGVPKNLVDAQATSGVDFSQQAQRDAFYDRILNDPSMQTELDPSTGVGVKYACNTSFGHAYPGRRYIELAKGMGENATVYSICDDDYTPAMNNVIDIIAKQLTSVCLPKPLVRDAQGKVRCDVVWELPPATAPHSTQTPVACSERPGTLSAPDLGHAAISKAGGAICKVNQLAVTQHSVPTGDGWYYDNFSAALQTTCDKARPQRVAFSDSAKPPRGVTVRLECLNETQHVVDTRTDVAPSASFPTIGSSCEQSAATDNADALCAVHLLDGSVDSRLFCHPKTNICVRACADETDCPAAWVCDKRSDTVTSTSSAARPSGSAICVNPTCGTD